MTHRPRILVVDDDPAIRQTLVEVLISAGYDAAETGNAADFQLILTAAPQPDSHVAQVRLTKPARMGALLADIDQALAVASCPRIGRWRFDAAARSLEHSGEKIRLTDKETAILSCLLAADGLVGREVLLAEIWGYSAAISTHTLETHIYRLRQKIEADPAQAVLLLTEAGGYRLNLEP